MDPTIHIPTTHEKPAFFKIFPKYYISIQKNCKDEEEIKEAKFSYNNENFMVLLLIE